MHAYFAFVSQTWFMFYRKSENLIDKFHVVLFVLPPIFCFSLKKRKLLYDCSGNKWTTSKIIGEGFLNSYFSFIFFWYQHGNRISDQIV